MIRGISINLSPVSPGQATAIAVDSDGDVEIVVYCLRSQPPPKQLFPCGRIVLRPGATGHVSANPTRFPPGSSGELQLNITDKYDGDTRVVAIPVVGGVSGESEGGMYA
jgi:hypothetical protein